MEHTQNELLAHFTVKDGKPEWKVPGYVKSNLPHFEGCKGILEVRRKWNRRSRGQNSYLWVCFDSFEEQSGVKAESIYTICKGLYAPRKDVLGFKIPKGSSEMTVGEMVGFIFDVSQFAKERGWSVPDSASYQEEQDTPHFINE